MKTDLIVAIGLVVGFNLLRLWVGARARRKRDRALEAWASAASLTYQADGSSIESEPFAALPLFHYGRSRRITNLLSGVRRGLDIRLFDFSYRPERKNRDPVVQTVAVIRTPGVSLTEFSLQTRHWWSRVVGDPAVVTFPDDTAFTKAHFLKAVDHDAARKHFRDTVRRHLTKNPGWNIEGIGEWVVCWRPRHLCAPAELPAFLDQARDLRDMLSGGRPSAAGRGALSEGQGKSG